MKLIGIAGFAAIILAGSGLAALAQDQYGNGYVNPNVQAGREYEDQQNVYNHQRDAYAAQRDAYDQRSGDYQVQRRDYQRRLRAYQRARADYDAQYGPGAYEYYYPAPPAPYDYDGPR